jgi:nitronate monooxygenase
VSATSDEDPASTAASATSATSNQGPKRWADIWSAGHSVSGVRALQSVDALVAEVEHEFHHALP